MRVSEGIQPFAVVHSGFLEQHDSVLISGKMFHRLVHGVSWYQSGVAFQRHEVCHALFPVDNVEHRVIMEALVNDHQSFLYLRINHKLLNGSGIQHIPGEWTGCQWLFEFGRIGIYHWEIPASFRGSFPWKLRHWRHRGIIIFKHSIDDYSGRTVGLETVVHEFCDGAHTSSDFIKESAHCIRRKTDSGNHLRKKRCLILQLEISVADVSIGSPQYRDTV